MKCLQCNHVLLEKAPKFCSECGCRLSSESSETPPAKPQEESESSLNIRCGTDAEMTDIGPESDTLDNQNSSISPKRPNEDTNLTPQKKKRKKKKKKTGIAEGPSSLSCDISLTGKEKKMVEDQSSGSDGSSCTGRDMHKPAESSSHLSKPENESTGKIQLDVSGLSIDAAKGQSDSIEESCVAPAKASPPQGQQTEKEKVEHKKKGQKSISTGAQTPLDQNANIKSSTDSQRETDRLDAEAQKNQRSSGHSPVKLEQSQKQQSARSGKKKTESDKRNETSQGIQQESPSKKKNLNVERQESSQNMMFGPQSVSKKSDGSSGDSPVKAEHSQKQKQSPNGKTDSAAHNKHNESNTESQRDAPPKRNPAPTQHISSSDRLTIYFHAVLSKDFKFNLEEDRVFIRAGGCIGDWENDLLELTVSRSGLKCTARSKVPACQREQSQRTSAKTAQRQGSPWPLSAGPCFRSFLRCTCLPALVTCLLCHFFVCRLNLSSIRIPAT